MSEIAVTPIPAFSDNYIWLLNRDGEAYVVDPGDAGPVLAMLESQYLSLKGILITHHHSDHVGGVMALKQATGCAVWGPANSPAPELDHTLSEGDVLEVLGSEFQVLAVPGHTLDHIAFFSDEQSCLFCGDTLFVGGCGRVFEGTPSQMRASLAKLRRLPETTRVFCAHEYTLSNLQFASLVEPDNEALRQTLRECEVRRRQNQPTVPSLLGDELRYNPFLRWGSPAVRQTLADRGRLIDDSADGIFTAVREWKNTG